MHDGKVFEAGMSIKEIANKKTSNWANAEFSSLLNTSGGQGMVWNGMERKFRYGIWKMPEWNGMEDFKNGMENNLPYFHVNSIQDFVHCIYTKICTDVV